MNENEFTKFLDTACNLSADQTETLLQSLSSHFRYVEHEGINCQNLAWRLKQAYSIIKYRKITKIT